MIELINSYWKPASFTIKTVIVALAIGFIVVIFGQIDGCNSRARLNKQVQKSEQKINDLLLEREKYKAANAALKLEISELEGEKKIPRQEVERIGLAIDQKIKEVENEETRFVEEKRAAGIDVSICERTIRSCERAKELGLYRADAVCECHEVTGSDNQ